MFFVRSESSLFSLKLSRKRHQDKVVCGSHTPFLSSPYCLLAFFAPLIHVFVASRTPPCSGNHPCSRALKIPFDLAPNTTCLLRSRVVVGHGRVIATDERIVCFWPRAGVTYELRKHCNATPVYLNVSTVSSHFAHLVSAITVLLWPRSLLPRVHPTRFAGSAKFGRVDCGRVDQCREQF